MYERDDETPHADPLLVEERENGARVRRKSSLLGTRFRPEND
jgi:hypothetical protein